MVGFGFKGAQMSSSKQPTSTKSSSEIKYSDNDSEQEDERIGQGKLYAPQNKGRPAAANTQLENSVGQGKLYSPQGAKIQNKPRKDDNSKTQSRGKIEEEKEGKLYSGDKNGRTDHSQLWNKGKGVLEASKGVAGDIKRSLSQVKDRIVDKLAAVPVPADALDNARQSLESIIKDVTHAAQGLTKDAVHKIKVRLAEILPFLSPNQTGKIVDDVEREVLDMSEAPSGDSLTTEEKSSSEHSNKHGNYVETRGVSASVTSATISLFHYSSLSEKGRRVLTWNKIPLL
ncbi:hypothetical protein SUGI_0947700 [Cryptomeria japonica]|nr:hypothetical protein SUGI_0947700 [Cryptomeria japonica]